MKIVLRKVQALSLTMVLSLVVCFPALADVGKVLYSIGVVTVEKPAISNLKRGDTLEEGDIVVTGPKAYAQLRMADGTKFAIRPDSRFEIEAFSAPATATEPAIGSGGAVSAKFKLSKGGFRSISGKLAKRDPNAYQLSTPTAVIRVRGTTSQAATSPNGDYFGCSDGAITVSNNGGSITLADNQFGFAQSFNAPPQRLTAPPAQLQDDGLAGLEETEESEEEGSDDSVNDETSEEGTDENSDDESGGDDSGGDDSGGDDSSGDDSGGDDSGGDDSGGDSSGDSSDSGDASSDGSGGSDGGGSDGGGSDSSGSDGGGSDGGATSGSGASGSTGGASSGSSSGGSSSGSDGSSGGTTSGGTTAGAPAAGGFSTGISSSGFSGANAAGPTGTAGGGGVTTVGNVTPTATVNEPVQVIVATNAGEDGGGTGGGAVDLTGGGDELVIADPRGAAFALNDRAVGFNTDSATAVLSADGSSLTAFDDTSVTGIATRYELGTAVNQNVGFDPTSSIRWGRWSQGTATQIQGGAASSLDLSNDSLHWVIASDAENVPTQAITGSASYTLVGNTDPTDGSGNVGFLGAATFNADFTNAIVQSNIQLGINNQNWTASGTGAITANLFNGLYNSVSVNGTAGGNGSFGGAFGGFNGASIPTGAGMTYQLTNSAGTTTVSGAAVFNTSSGGQ